MEDRISLRAENYRLKANLGMIRESAWRNC
jgi:hypothetical protein